MKANIVDLRYKMKDVLKALDRQERVEILFRGKTKGVIMPVGQKTQLKMTEHPFFGSRSDDKEKVSHVMQHIRKGRYRAI